jgi:hypothetical protein
MYDGKDGASIGVVENGSPWNVVGGLRGNVLLWRWLLRGNVLSWSWLWSAHCWSMMGGRRWSVRGKNRMMSDVCVRYVMMSTSDLCVCMKDLCARMSDLLNDLLNDLVSDLYMNTVGMSDVYIKRISRPNIPRLHFEILFRHPLRLLEDLFHRLCLRIADLGVESLCLVMQRTL